MLEQQEIIVSSAGRMSIPVWQLWCLFIPIVLSVIVGAWVLARAIREGRNLRVSFALDDLTRKAILDALNSAPEFIESVRGRQGLPGKDGRDGEKGEKGDAADPQEEVMRIFDDPHATATLINGMVTRANHQLGEQVQEIIEREVREPTEQLKRELAEVQSRLDGLRSDIEEAKQLLSQAQMLYDNTTEVTAEMAAAARHMEKIVSESDIVKRIFGLDQPSHPTSP